MTGFPSSDAGISVCHPFRFWPLKSDIAEGLVDASVDVALDFFEGKGAQARGRVLNAMIHNRCRGVFLIFISVG
ncbi:MAG: hypothetical protein GWP39_02560 [Planctomycetia bacterium]|nr:hypothetical protein [Planctomycetia bacterium]